MRTTVATSPTGPGREADRCGSATIDFDGIDSGHFVGREDRGWGLRFILGEGDFKEPGGAADRKLFEKWLRKKCSG